MMSFQEGDKGKVVCHCAKDGCNKDKKSVEEANKGSGGASHVISNGIQMALIVIFCITKM